MCMEQLNEDSINKQWLNIICATQHGFVESKSCQTNTVFYDRLIGPVGKGECFGTAFFIFKAFDLVPQNTLALKNLELCRINTLYIRNIKISHNVQKMVIKKSASTSASTSFPQIAIAPSIEGAVD